MAREQAFEAGRQEGLQEAAAALEQMLGMAMATCAHYLQGLSAAQAAANEEMVRDATHVAVTMLRKLHPAFCRLHGVEEIERAVAECLENRIEQARVTVKVAPDLVEAVEAKCSELVASSGYEGKLIVTPDPALGLGDCRVDWGDGGAEQLGAKAWAEIDRIVAETIGNISNPMAEE
jgi:flagellar assembly protein FliH